MPRRALMVEYQLEVSYPGFDLKLWILGTIFASVGYGVVLSLLVACMGRFLRLSKLADDARPNRFRTFLLAYAIWMFLLSTLALLSAIIVTVDHISPIVAGAPGQKNGTVFAHFGEATSLVLASWTSDCLMVRNMWTLSIPELSCFHIQTDLAVLGNLQGHLQAETSASDYDLVLACHTSCTYVSKTNTSPHNIDQNYQSNRHMLYYISTRSPQPVHDHILHSDLCIEHPHHNTYRCKTLVSSKTRPKSPRGRIWFRVQQTYAYVHRIGRPDCGVQRHTCLLGVSSQPHVGGIASASCSYLRAFLLTSTLSDSTMLA